MATKSPWICPLCLKSQVSFSEAEHCAQSHGRCDTPEERRNTRKEV
jgi:hypothetical protein